MACLRRQAPNGRIGVIPCDEKGCLHSLVSLGRGPWAVENASQTDCLLQLRLRAGDAEDTGGTRVSVQEREHCPDESDREYESLFSRIDHIDVWNPTTNQWDSYPKGQVRIIFNHGRIYIKPDNGGETMGLPTEPGGNGDELGTEEFVNRRIDSIADTLVEDFYHQFIEYGVDREYIRRRLIRRLKKEGD